MTTILAKLSLCSFQCHNPVSLGKSHFKFNQLPISYEWKSPAKCSIIGSSRSRRLPVSAEIGKSANNSHLSSSVGPPSLIQVPLKAEDLFLLCVIMLGTYQLLSGVVGVIKFIVDGTFLHLYYVLVRIRKQQIERKKLMKKIALDGEDGSISCSD